MTFKKLTEDELMAWCPNCKKKDANISWNLAYSKEKKWWVHGCRDCGKNFTTVTKYNDPQNKVG